MGPCVEKKMKIFMLWANGLYELREILYYKLSCLIRSRWERWRYHCWLPLDLLLHLISLYLAPDQLITLLMIKKWNYSNMMNFALLSTRIWWVRNVFIFLENWIIMNQINLHFLSLFSFQPPSAAVSSILSSSSRDVSSLGVNSVGKIMKYYLTSDQGDWVTTPDQCQQQHHLISWQLSPQARVCKLKLS